MKNKILSFLLIPLFFSCSKRNLSYFSDYDKTGVTTEGVTSVAKEPIIQAGDLLEITVTSDNPSAAAPFNRISQRPLFTTESSEIPPDTPEGYLVDENGIINFPVLGRIKVAGVTKNETTLNLTNLLTNYLGNPVVSIRYLNYRVSVLGEVRKPNTYLVPNERISVIEALSMAGDLTVFGKRENIMVINETNGERTVARLNLNEKEVLNSPHFYLQPNDIVYVEPVKSRKDQASLTRANISMFLAVVTAASVVYLAIK